MGPNIPVPAPRPEVQAQKDLWEFNLSPHEISAEGMKRVHGLRSAAKAMANALIDMVPAGRSQSLALTDLESMLFNAVGGISREFPVTESINNLPPEEDSHLPVDKKE